MLEIFAFVELRIFIVSNRLCNFKKLIILTSFFIAVTSFFSSL